MSTAPRILPEDLEANILSEHYFTAREACDAQVPGSTWPISLGLLTFCVLVLKNGFTVTGESAVASPENFNAQIGKDIARANAVAKMWPLMGYELKTKLAGIVPMPVSSYIWGDILKMRERHNMITGHHQMSVTMTDGNVFVFDTREGALLAMTKPQILDHINKQPKGNHA